MAYTYEIDVANHKKRKEQFIGPAPNPNFTVAKQIVLKCTNEIL